MHDRSGFDGGGGIRTRKGQLALLASRARALASYATPPEGEPCTRYVTNSSPRWEVAAMSDDENQPGPEPERLKLPDEDWKEALRRALSKDRLEEVDEDREGRGRREE